MATPPLCSSARPDPGRPRSRPVEEVPHITKAATHRRGPDHEHGPLCRLRLYLAHSHLDRRSTRRHADTSMLQLGSAGDAARTIAVRGGEEQRRNHQRASRGLYRREPLLAAIAGMQRPSLPLRSNALLGVIVGPRQSPVRPVRSLAAAPHGPQPRVGLAAPASCGNWAAPTWQPKATPIGRP